MRFADAYISSLLLLTPTLWAEAESTAFSKGLQHLAELGLPEMKDAEWVNISGNSADAFLDSYEFKELGTRLSGNAWKLKSNPPAYIEFGSAKRLESPDSDEKPEPNNDNAGPGIFKKMLESYKEENPEPEPKPEPKKTAPPESKAAKDAARIAEALGKPSKAEELNNRMRWGDSNLHGRLLLFAAQLRASGDTESSNRLAAALFQAVNDDSALINGAISHLADTRYDAATGRFFEDTGWEKYHSTLRSLLEKFPRGWDKAPAVALLVSNLEKRSSESPPPSLPGIELNPEALALLDKLSEKKTTATSDEDLAAARGIELSDYPPEQRTRILTMLRADGAGVSFSSQEPWLLPSEGNGRKTDPSPIEKLKRMGMDGLIALAAVATDGSLLPIRSSRNSQSHYSSNQSSAEEIRTRYRNLDRPVSRGEIAVWLLSSVLPSGDNNSYNSSSEPNPADISLAAIDFWKTNKDKSAVELATLYIAEGNSSQQSYASNFLATSKDPAAHAAFEKTVLSSDDPLNLIGYVEQYLGARKAAAKSFANAYISRLRENPPDEEQLQRTRFGYQIREAGGLENYLKKLSFKVGDASLKKMLSAALGKATGDSSGEKVSPIMAMAPAVQEVPLTECLTTFGKAAGLASSGQWMEIHQLLLQRIYHELRNSEREDASSFQALPPEVMEIWKPLIARTDTLPTEGEFPKYSSAYGAKTVGDASTLIIELATAPGLAYTFNHFAQVEDGPDKVMAFVRKRVADWSSGKEPEPWPDAVNVSEERSEEISGKLDTLKAGEIIPYAKSLTSDERLELLSITRNYSDPDSVPPGILELRETIVSLKPVFDQDHDNGAAAKLGIKLGDKVTAELLTRISDALLNDAANSSTTTVMFLPAPMNLGSSLYVTTAKDLDKQKLRSTGVSYLPNLFEQHGNPESISTISVQSSADVRTLKDGKPVTLESGSSGLETLSQSLEIKSVALPYIRISVLTREDAEKIKISDLPDISNLPD